MLFALPAIGYAIGMPQAIFGAWAATTILNTAQLTAAATLYDEGLQGVAAGAIATASPGSALHTATLVNIARVTFIPIIVLFAIWFYIVRPAGGGEIEVGKVVKEKFPVFVLGFFAVVILNTAGVFGEPVIKAGKISAAPLAKFYGGDIMKWFFAVGFAGIGLNIVWDDMKKAGGAAFGIGVIAAIGKALFSLAVIFAFGVETLTFT